MTASGVLIAMGAVVLLRLSWGRPVRSTLLNVQGWLLLLTALVLGASDAGAWGMAVVSTGAIGAALVLLGWAALRAPQAGSKASSRRVNMLPGPGEPKRIGQRIVTFLLTIPVSFIVVLLVGIAARGLAVSVGWSEADGNVLTLFLMPVLWAVLMAVMLLETRRSRQIAMLVVPALVSGGLIFAGVGA